MSNRCCSLLLSLSFELLDFKKTPIKVVRSCPLPSAPALPGRSSSRPHPAAHPDRLVLVFTLRGGHDKSKMRDFSAFEIFIHVLFENRPIRGGYVKHIKTVQCRW